MSGSEAAAASSPPALLSTKTFFLDNFALRQWDDPNYGGTRVSYDKAAFIARIQEEFDKVLPMHVVGRSCTAEWQAQRLLQMTLRRCAQGTHVISAAVAQPNTQFTC